MLQSSYWIVLFFNLIFARTTTSHQDGWRQNAQSQRPTWQTHDRNTAKRLHTEIQRRLSWSSPFPWSFWQHFDLPLDKKVMKPQSRSSQIIVFSFSLVWVEQTPKSHMNLASCQPNIQIIVLTNIHWFKWKVYL